MEKINILFKILIILSSIGLCLCIFISIWGIVIFEIKGFDYKMIYTCLLTGAISIIGYLITED